LSRTLAPGTAEASTTKTAYDAGYRVTQVTDPLGKITRRTYDARDRVLTVTDPLNRVSTTTYDLAGRPLSQRRADGALTQFSYDAADRVIAVTDALSQTTTKTYDAAGRLRTLTDPKGNLTTWTYDSFGRLAKKTYADGTSELTTYDALSRSASATTPAGVTSTFAYDARDRLIFTDWADSTPDSARDYDTVGRLRSLVTVGVSIHTYAYDAAGQLLSETTAPVALAPATFTVGYAYDLDGRRAQLTYPDTGVVAYDYTARGQLAALASDGPPPLATFTYDLSGRRTKKTLENGTTTTYAYDVASQLTSLVHRNAGAVELARFAYAYDLGGRRTAKTITGTAAIARAETYGYDAIDQVTTATYGATGTETFAYDAMGNRVSATLLGQGAVSYTTNALNQYTALGSLLLAPGASPSYDTNGNTLTLPGQRTYVYDGKSRLTQATVGSPGEAAFHVASFVYDAQNRQVRRTVDGVTTYFVWDNWSLLAEYQVRNGALVQIARYVHGPRQDEIILQQKTTEPTPAYLHEDALGSTYLLTNAAGAVVERYRYTAFGEVSAFDNRGTTVAQPATRFLYSGREWIPEIGLNDHRNRFYIPIMGRWLSRDPIAEEGGINLYAYVSNMPINFTDPLGLRWFGGGDDGLWSVGRGGSLVPDGEGTLGGFL
jgi:RHS repeat-associated protein